MRIFGFSEIRDLGSLRTTVLKFICFMVILPTSITLILRLVEGNFVLAYANIILIAIAGFCYLMTRDQYQDYICFSFTLSCILLVLVLVYFGKYEIRLGYPFILGISLCSFILLRSNLYKNLIFSTAFCGIIILTIKKGYPFYEMFTIMLFCYVVYSAISRLIHKLDADLNNSIISKQGLIEKLESQNDLIKDYNNVLIHDLKSPIKNIKTFTDRIKKQLTKEGRKESTMDYFEYIQFNIESVENLIQQLLHKQIVEDNAFICEELDMDELIRSVMTKYQHLLDEEKLNLTINNLSKVYANEINLKILFSNLISNAIHYQPQDKNHTIKIEVSQTDDNTHHWISIKDNGLGIDEEYFDLIFQPFKRLHVSSEYEGSGIGLSICKKIVERHGGNIIVKSQPNQGTEFEICLPKNTKIKEKVTLDEIPIVQ